MGPQEIIGQAIGIIAFIIAFIAYQAKTSKKLLVVQTVALVCFCAHYLLIGAITAFAMNTVGIIRNIMYYYNDKKIFSYKWWPYVMSVIMAVIGAFTWQGWYSLLLIAGLSVNTVCMSLPTSQGIRKSLLFTCPPVLIYNVFVRSYGGVINETLTIISAVIGIVRQRKSDGKIKN